MSKNQESTEETTAEPKSPEIIENSTDATRGQPLGMRAQLRRAELEAALAKLPETDLRARNDIELVISSIDSLLTGGTENLPQAVAADLNRLLENNKHLAETHPAVNA